MGGLYRAPYIRRCLEAAKKGGPAAYLYLCGTTRLARAVEEEFALRSGGSALTAGVLTLEGLLKRVPGPRERVGEPEILLHLWMAERAPRHRGGPRPSTTLDHVRGVLKLWEQLRLEGDLPAARQETSLGWTLSPLEILTRSLVRAQREDQAEALLQLEARLVAKPSPLHYLVVDGFEGYGRALASVVDALAQNAFEAYVLTEGDALHPPSWAVQTTEPGPDTPHALHASLLESLVHRRAAPSRPVPLDHVGLVAATGGPGEEVEAIARHVRDRLRESPDLSVLVAFAGLPSYAPRILETFPRFGLVPELLLPGSLLASPAAQPARRLLALATEGYPHADVLELVEDVEENGVLGAFFPPPLTASHVARVAREAGALRGRDAFSGDLREASLLGPEGLRSDERAALYASVAEGFERLFQPLLPLEDPASSEELLENLGRALEALGFYRGPSGPQRRTVLSSVHDLLARAERLLPGAPGPTQGRWPAPALRELFDRALSLVEARGSTSGPGVPVTGLHDAGLVDVDLMVVGGLSTEHLPSDRPSPLVPTGARARLGLPSHEELLRRERVRFARVLARARREVLLTYAARSGQEETLPSLLLNDLLALGRPALPPHTAATTSLAKAGRCYSAKDALIQVARTLEEPPPALGGSSPPPPPSPAPPLALVAREARGGREMAWRSMFASLALERARRERPRGGAFDGPSGGGHAQALARARFSSGRFGVRQVQEYLRCPYRFYLDEVLGLSEVEELTEEADRATLGSEVHRLLFELHERGRAPDGSLTVLTPERAAAEAPRLVHDLSEVLDRLRPRSVEVETLRRRWLGRPGDPAGGAWRALVQALVEDGAEVRPTHVEIAFDDRPLRDPALHDAAAPFPPLVLGSYGDLAIRLVGRIDRLGRDLRQPDGIVVDDYKTGRARPQDQDRARDAVAEGLELQLPLYAAAAIQALGQAGQEVFPHALRYVWLSDPQATGFVPLLRPATRPRDEARQRSRAEALRELSVRHAQDAAGGVLEGRFPINGRFQGFDGDCRYAGACPHALGCRFSARRLSGEEAS